MHPKYPPGRGVAKCTNQIIMINFLKPLDKYQIITHNIIRNNRIKPIKKPGSANICLSDVPLHCYTVPNDHCSSIQDQPHPQHHFKADTAACAWEDVPPLARVLCQLRRDIEPPHIHVPPCRKTAPAQSSRLSEVYPIQSIADTLPHRNTEAPYI